MELICFLKEYITSPKHVGALSPSSHDLAELMTEAAGVRQANSVVEFGPGTGVFTEVIVRKLRRDAKFFAIEISEEFVKLVRKKCPGVNVIHDSATQVRRHLEAAGLDHCDCIISGIPFALFEDSLQNQILDAAHDALKPGGVFVTFTYFYSPWLPQGRKFHRKLRARFDRIQRTSIVWRNMFPAFAYRAFKDK